MICSPEPVEDEASEEDEEPKEKKIKTPQKPENMADSDERWIATHARQVRTNADVSVKLVPNTLTKINLAHLIFLKFCQSIYFDPFTKI